MDYPARNKSFIEDKINFFARPSMSQDIHAQFTATENYARTHDYTFLLNNQSHLETEFTQLFAVLKKEKDNNSAAFWMYCYYCATLLEQFYKAYEQKAKETEFNNYKQQIKNRLNNVEQTESEEHFIKSLENSITNSFKNLTKAPFHVSQIRDYVAYSNLCRVYWVFCRLTLISGFALAKDLEFIDKIDAILGTQTDVGKIIAALQAPNGVLNYFSVGLFLARFVIDGALLVRHTFFPSEAEKAAGTTAFARFKHELYKRHCNFANDLVWATVNFLTNFSQITHISGPAAGAITAVFLGFDLCMILYKNYLAHSEYLIKKDQYEDELGDYNNIALHLCLNDAQKAHINMLEKQLAELEITHKNTEAKFYFLAAAAALVMLGFSSALLFSPPGMVVASFFVGLFAVAMYLSTGEYTKYHEKSLRLQHDGHNPVALKEYETARNDFIYAMVKNTTVPSMLIITFAICWPAAVVLAAVFMGYELYHAYDQHQSAQQVKQLALNPPVQQKEFPAEVENDDDYNQSCFSCAF
ncbi:MAG: hypothetical protein P4L65_10075 [Legionella sp.]|nr:hypothetical protein [Legionella sp.]